MTKRLLPPGSETLQLTAAEAAYSEAAALCREADDRWGLANAEVGPAEVALAPDFSFEADAPKAVELTLFHQPDRRRSIVNLLNFQKDLPNIPVEGGGVRVRLDGQIV